MVIKLPPLSGFYHVCRRKPMNFQYLAVGLVAVTSLCHSGTVVAQQMRQPYSSQLRTDPDVGTIQAAQRHGRPLRTDPAEGDGYPLFVYPTASTNTIQASAVVNENGSNASAQGQSGRSAAVVSTKQVIAAPVVAPLPFDATRGLRQSSSSSAVPAVSAQGVASEATSFGQVAAPFAMPFGMPFAQPYAQGYTNFGAAGPTIMKLYHQPLIQVKVRVVEVGRNNALEVSSILDYISNGGDPSLITAHNINNNRQRTTGVTRFPSNDLLTIPANGTSIANLSAGTGGLINLTSEHINFIASFLATELNADVITAPQVVTLNGQNVEFSAGSKQPFQLGQSVIQNDTNVIQQFFYKHVGSYISVTPRIVDWGLHGEGKGNAAIVEGEVKDYNGLISMMFDAGMANNTAQATWAPYKTPGKLLPFSIRQEVLMLLNDFTREDIHKFIDGKPAYANIFEDLPPGCTCDGTGGCQCNWKPEACTLDLELVVRLSDAVPINLTASRDSGSTASTPVNTEGNVRAISNIVQVKSGHGVVMAGLIGEHDIEEAAKVPILGDVPVVGFLFRSKTTSREKTEILIFVEATVLNSEPEVARAESSNDFILSHPHVMGDLLDSPLEFGMYRAGFGSYLPPTNCQEDIFWERLGRTVRRASTECNDAFK